MKVIKRNGRAVEYEREKIETAINKANNEVREKEKASKEDIEKIINYIEEFGKKRMLVEDIQDIIEQKLMEFGKYDLAKKYIVYRYTRALIRKSNTTDESILSLIKNGNVIENNLGTTAINVAIQRDLIAGEVSKDLTKRMLLPEKISNAHEEGVLCFHNADYFLQPMHNWSVINLQDMLDNGTVLNGILIETPKSFLVACTVTTQIIALVASSQYGEQWVNMGCLGKYLRKSKEELKKQIEQINDGTIKEKMIDALIQARLNKELKSGVQTILYQTNTLIAVNGKSPKVNIMFDSDDEYTEENKMIMEEMLRQKNEGLKNEDGEYIVTEFPKIIENQDCKLKSTFNQGIISINLQSIGIIAKSDEKIFWKLLDERLELCKEAIMCKHYALLGTSADVSPILWRYGAIARLKRGEKIDKLLKNGYSSLSLGYFGIHEMSKAMKGDNGKEEFELRVKEYLANTVLKWKEETGLEFILENV